MATRLTLRAYLSVIFFCLAISLRTTVSKAVSHAHPNLQTTEGDLRRILDVNQTITVHLVPHTYDDVGWLKTVDEYYYGGMTPGSVTNYCQLMFVQTT